jgi:deoxyribonuclease-2
LKSCINNRRNKAIKKEEIMNLIIFLLIITALKCVNSFSCLDENGSPVDSWNAIKAHNSYTYYVYNSSTLTYNLSKYNVSQTKDGCIMQTVGQIYSYPNSQEDVAYGTYNDEPADGQSASSTYAHAKGVLMTDKFQGFWLVHSMPLWPNSRSVGNPGIFPSDTYAQSLMCVTINANTSNTIANNLRIDRPFIYDYNITTEMSNQLPEFNLWIDKVQPPSTDTNSSTPFLSSNGQVFYQMAKSKAWAMDLWDDLVAPYFNTSINVETWRSGSGGRMGSICNGNESGNNPYSFVIDEYDVYEISNMEMNDGDSWTGTQDHSKWAIARPSNQVQFRDTSPNQIIDEDIKNLQGSIMSCVGDMNRMCSQEKRGGGALCTEDYNLWVAFNATIVSEEPCWEYNPCQPFGHSTQCYWCPTTSPTSAPTDSPTASPSSAPTVSPTASPTSAPTVSPTEAPTDSPTEAPTDSPTVEPTVAVLQGVLKFNSEIAFELSTMKLNENQITAAVGATCESMGLPITVCIFVSQSYEERSNRRRLSTYYDIVAVIQSMVEYTETQDPNTLYTNYSSALVAAITPSSAPTSGAFLTSMNAILINESEPILESSDLTGVTIDVSVITAPTTQPTEAPSGNDDVTPNNSGIPFYENDITYVIVGIVIFIVIILLLYKSYVQNISFSNAMNKDVEFDQIKNRARPDILSDERNTLNPLGK